MPGFRRSESGQTSTEYMLIISVLVIAVTAASYVFVPTFQGGVDTLAQDASSILASGQIGGIGLNRGGGGTTVGTHALTRSSPIGGTSDANGGSAGLGSPISNPAPTTGGRTSTDPNGTTGGMTTLSVHAKTGGATKGGGSTTAPPSGSAKPTTF